MLQFSRVPVNFSTIALVEYAENEAILANISPSSPYYENALHTIHINGKSLNIVPENYDFTLDNSADCSGNIENSPWLGVEIDIPQLLSTLESEGHLDSSILNNAKYSSSIIGGLEFWGRNLVELEVKDYTIYVKSNQQNQTQNNQTTTNQTQANNTQTNQTQQQTQASCQNSADVGNLRCSPVYNAYDWCQEYQGKIQWLLKDYCGDGEGCIGSECVSLEDIPYLEIECIVPGNVIISTNKDTCLSLINVPSDETTFMNSSIKNSLAASIPNILYISHMLLDITFSFIIFG